MCKKILFAVMLAAVLMVVLSTAAMAQDADAAVDKAEARAVYASPNTIMYQGRVTTAAGTPISDTVTVTFGIYANPSGGTPLWQGAWLLNPNDNGIFSQEIGTIPDTVFTGAVRYLQITVRGEAMDPRQTITSAPYSFHASAMGPNSVGTAAIIDGTIAATDISDNAVTSAKIANATIAAADLADNSVTSAKITDATVATADLGDNAVTSAKIADATIAAADLADNSVTSAKITDATVATADLADNAVTSAKIADATIAAADLADNSVTSAKIVDGTILLTDIGRNSATTGQTLKWNGSVWAPSTPATTKVQTTSGFQFVTYKDTSTPIAYGFVDAIGVRKSGSTNWSSSWDASNLRYEIIITGESYYFSDYTTVVTPCSQGYTFSTTSIGGNLIVYFYIP